MLILFERQYCSTSRRPRAGLEPTPRVEASSFFYAVFSLKICSLEIDLYRKSDFGKGLQFVKVLINSFDNQKSYFDS